MNKHKLLAYIKSRFHNDLVSALIFVNGRLNKWRELSRLQLGKSRYTRYRNVCNLYDSVRSVLLFSSAMKENNANCK